jgi:hypothetical protein
MLARAQGPGGGGRGRRKPSADPRRGWDWRALFVVWVERGCGDPDAYWRQTPRTFQLILKGANRRDDAAFRHQLIAAYYAGFYSHEFKEFPPLPEAWLRPSGDPPPPRNWEAERLQFTLAGAAADARKARRAPKS